MVLPSMFCHVDKVTHMLVGMMIVTEGIVVHWEHMAHVIEFVERLHFLVQRHDARSPLRSCVPLVHTLNKSNCVKKRMVATTFDLSDQSKAPKLLAESMWNYEI